MSDTPGPQRAWRAACPNCGAPVDFASAASPVAVCSFCRSTLARDGEALRRIGVSAELFDDHSPLQLGTSGRHQGVAFRLVGRLQMQTAEGRWNEWSALFDDGRHGWLSEDNGRYVLGFDAPLADLPPEPGALALGATVPLAGRRWQVGAVTRAKVGAAEGELPAPPAAGEITLVELRSPTGEVGTLDYSDPRQPAWSIGRGVDLADLQLQGLKDAAEKAVAARGAECPNCGSALEIRLETTQSIVCGNCKAVVDVSQGVGGDLKHHLQGARPKWPQLIPLGATGELAFDGPKRAWQVVGFAERWEDAEDAEDEPSPWHEYLLYHRGQGFAFLVQSEEGWSWAVPITGAPEVRGRAALWNGTTFRELYRYGAHTHYVLGEFYWRVERDQRTSHIDYGAPSARLNREQSADEVTWSLGAPMPAEQVRQAFGLKDPRAAALASDEQPLAASGAAGRSWVTTLVLLMVVLLVLVVLARACSADDCDRVRATFGAESAEYRDCQRSGSGFRTSGGSWGGGGSSGGGHK